MLLGCLRVLTALGVEQRVTQSVPLLEDLPSSGAAAMTTKSDAW